MATQVWDGSGYMGAELPRFGASGTPKEALVWDGTQYVKVWPMSPYPATGTWSGTTGSLVTTVVEHTIAESGSYNFVWAVTWGGTGNRLGYANIAVNDGAFAGATPVISAPGTSVSQTTAPQTFEAGVIIQFRALSGAGTFPATGEWSITKV